MKPNEIVEKIERYRQQIAAGSGERFTGYAVMGVAFGSGHVLALRRFPASTLGEGYTSVWVRNPEGEWTFFQNAPEELSCSRYYGNAVETVVRSPIHVTWTGPESFVVDIPQNRLRWEVILTESRISRAVNGLSRILPERIWENRSLMNTMGKVVGPLLNAGKLSLSGAVPNGQSFIANPRLVWHVSESAAVFDGKDLGRLMLLQKQVRIGEFWIPRSGLFVIGNATMEVYDPLRHDPALLAG